MRFEAHPGLPGRNFMQLEGKVTCDYCDGSGETRSFRGESRFLLSVDECPVCGGMGFLFVPETGEGGGGDPPARGRPDREESP